MGGVRIELKLMSANLKLKLKKLRSKKPVIFFSLLFLAILISVFVVFQTTYLAQSRTNTESKAAGSNLQECLADCKQSFGPKGTNPAPSYLESCNTVCYELFPQGGGGGTECDEGCKYPRQCQNGQCIGNPGEPDLKKCQSDGDCKSNETCDGVGSQKKCIPRKLFIK